MIYVNQPGGENWTRRQQSLEKLQHDREIEAERLKALANLPALPEPEEPELTYAEELARSNAEIKARQQKSHWTGD